MPPARVTQVEPAAPAGVLRGEGPTGTFVGTKVNELEAELARLKAALGDHNARLQELRARTVQNSQAYHGTVAAINARLQVGTTPGNPVLSEQWKQAQSELDRVNDDIAALNALANAVASDSTMSTFLLESVRSAYQVSGAVDEDHRQLALLEDDVQRTVVSIDRLLNEISEDLSRQTTYVSGERSNLNTLSLAIKNGELFGQALTTRQIRGTPAQRASARAPVAAANRPLVVIRFDRANVNYEQALYTAVSRALERRPEASFNIVAVTPDSGTPAQVALETNKSKRNAQAVLRSLTDMGLPGNRVAISTTTSTQVSGSEVHVYVR